MYANYHTHSYHCRHALGQPREYVEQAIQGGLRILGFSDHIPMPFHNGYPSGFRMPVSETETYINEILALREEYKDEIQILIGYEAEYYPAEYDAMIENIENYPCDYLILGQHFTRNEYDGAYSGDRTGRKSVVADYVDQIITAMETGRYSYVAHPDLIHYRGDVDFYKWEIRRLCEAAKEENVPLEINMLGIRDKRHYPFMGFWKIAGEVGAPVILGCDAHEPAMLSDHTLWAEAEAFAEKMHLEPLRELPLKPIWNEGKSV